jgi:hypothetical protein
VWEYWDGGAWSALDVEDGIAFELIGVNAVSWVPPSDWATTTVNGVTAYWVRLRVSAVGTWVQSPTQQYRDIYTVTWPDIDIDDAQVPGDIAARLRIKAHNRGDEGGVDEEIDEDLPNSWANRYIIGLRSVDRGGGRGGNFVSYINLADEQNPIGIDVTVGTGSAFANDIEAPTGRRITHTTTGNGVWETAATITLGPSIARDFYGIYRAFLRAERTDGDSDNIQIRLRVRSGSGGVSSVTDYKEIYSRNPWQLLDFKTLEIPATGLINTDELPDELEIDVQVNTDTASLTLYLFDVILIPTDEWAGEFLDTAHEDDSNVDNGKRLDVDSVSFLKRDLRALVETADASAFISSVYRPISSKPAILQANADQRLHFLAARGALTGTHTGAGAASALTDSTADFINAGVKAGQTIYNITDGSSATITGVTATTVSGTLSGGTDDDWDNTDEYLILCPNWRSEPWTLHSIQLNRNARYMAMRGDR